MKCTLAAWLGVLVLTLTCGGIEPAMARTLRAQLSAAQRSPAPGLSVNADDAALEGPSTIYSNTTFVRALATDSKTLWVATSGGLEEYDVATLERTATYSTKDGLPSLDVDNVKLSENSVVVVSVKGHDCAMLAGTGRFACSERSTLHRSVGTPRMGAEPGDHQPTEELEGASITARVFLKDGSEFVGTYGLGVWLHRHGGLERVTPRNQLASNHVVAMTEWGQSTWFATFDRGLSVLSNGTFHDAPLSPRMLNDVLGTPAGLFVATSEGLFISDDGEGFRRDSRVPEPAVTDLAYDAHRGILYVAATNSLWEVDLIKPRKYARSTYQPGGTHSLQAVDVGEDGSVFLASEDRGVLKREAPKNYVAFDRLAGYASSWVIDVLAVGNGAALAGTLRHGVFATDGKSPVDSRVDPWVLFLGRDASSKDTVFVGTQQGAAIVERGEIRTLPGLPNSCVHTMARLSDGLWVGTEGGVAVYQ